SSFLDRPLLQALLWSFLFHLLLFGGFRIRFANFIDSSPQMAPIAVSLEQEVEGGGITLIAEQDPIESKATLFTQSLDESEWLSASLDKLSSRIPTPKITLPTFTALTDDELAKCHPPVT